MKVIIVQKKSKGFEIPDDGVILWYGIASEVPSGYTIYSELTGHFPYGGSSNDLTSRGSSTHVHSYPSTALNLNTHTHTVPSGSVGNASSQDVGYAGATYAKPAHSHVLSGSVTTSGEHRHTLGNTSSGSSIPKHKKLYYIKAVA